MSAPQIKDRFYKIELNKTIWEVPQRYQLLSPVGAGAYGQVSSALDTQNNVKVAVKKLARPFQSVIHAKRTYREIRMLKHMNHENVIGLLDIFTPYLTLEDFNDVYLVTPLMGADLNNIIKTQRLSDDHVQFLVYQILRGMKYIHSAGIIHRDLKPSNIAVNEDCELKILDFGLARHTEDQMTGYVATRWYRAPEIVLNWMHYGQTVDVWSVGCIMAEMLTGKALFPGNDHIHQLRLVLTLTGTPPQHLLDKITDEDPIKTDETYDSYLVPSEVTDNSLDLSDIDQLTRVLSLVGTPNQKLLDKISSPEARNYVASMPKWPKKDFREVFIGANPLAIDLMERMLDLDSETRITAEQALAHPYLTQYADPSDEPTATPFDQSFENMELSIPEWRRLCYEETEGRGAGS